jgi:hypothetical protein
MHLILFSVCVVMAIFNLFVAVVCRDSFGKSSRLWSAAWTTLGLLYAIILFFWP